MPKFPFFYNMIFIMSFLYILGLMKPERPMLIISGATNSNYKAGGCVGWLWEKEGHIIQVRKGSRVRITSKDLLFHLS